MTLCYFAECHCAEFRIWFIDCYAEVNMPSVIMLKIIMLSVIMLNVVMLSVVMLNVVKQSAVAPFH